MRNRPVVTVESTAMLRLDVMKLLGTRLAGVLGDEAMDSVEDEARAADQGVVLGVSWPGLSKHRQQRMKDQKQRLQ